MSPAVAVQHSLYEVELNGNGTPPNVSRRVKMNLFILHDRKCVCDIAVHSKMQISMSVSSSRHTGQQCDYSCVDKIPSNFRIIFLKVTILLQHMWNTIYVDNKLYLDHISKTKSTQLFNIVFDLNPFGAVLQQGILTFLSVSFLHMAFGLNYFPRCCLACFTYIFISVAV